MTTKRFDTKCFSAIIAISGVNKTIQVFFNLPFTLVVVISLQLKGWDK